MLHYNQPIFRRKSKLVIGMSDANVNSPNPNWQEQQDLIDKVAELENKLQKALTSIDSYQNERFELLDTVIQLRLKLQYVVDILEK
jgi:hypothetical protein